MYLFQEIETDETASKAVQAPAFDVDKLIPDLKDLIAGEIKSSKSKLASRTLSSSLRVGFSV